MPLLEPITFLSAPARQAAAAPVITDKAGDLSSYSFLQSFDAGSMTQRLQPLVTSAGIHSLSRSNPPTPPRGPPPTPRRRAHNELSRAYPPTPPRGPPPTPRDEDIFNLLSPCEPPSPPNGPPLIPQEYKADVFNSISRRGSPIPPRGPLTPSHLEDYDLFSSLSRRDPPTPPRGPPPSPCRRDIFNELSRCDPPTPPRGPPPSPKDFEDGRHSDLSRSAPPSPPRGPPPTPRRRSSKNDVWTLEETALLISVCRSDVELGWYQIAGLFHGKDGDVCRRKYRETQLSEQSPLSDDCDNKSNEPLLPIDEVPGLSRGSSPVGSPRLSIDFDSDVECAVEYGMKTIAHLSDELNSALEKEWDNVKDRVQDQHAFFTYSTGIWTVAPSFLEMAEL